MNGKIKSILLLFSLTLSFVHAQEKATVVSDSFYSYNTNSYIKFNTILPKGYYKNQERYTAIYLLHGHGGDQNDWINRTSLVKYAKDFNFIIITPEGKNSWYTNSPFVKNQNFEDYIIKELIPTIEKKFRVISTKQGRVIAGLSMGGYGAMKFALKYPNYFFYAASFSGAFRWPSMIATNPSSLTEGLRNAFGEKKSEHWLKNDVLVLADSISNVNLPYLYISVGKDDNLPSLLESNRAFVEKLRLKNVLYEYHELPGTHNWVFWDKEVLTFLQKLTKFDPLKP